MSLFVTGTDTEVGKTFVAGALAGCLREDGLDIGVWKPAQSGYEPGHPQTDSARLKRLSGVPDAESAICPYTFGPAVTPALAARLAGVDLCLQDFVDSLDHLPPHQGVIGEGAGGLYAPLACDGTVADLMQRLNWPVLVVARPGLGTINHSVLTIQALRALGLSIGGIIFNGYEGPLPCARDFHELLRTPQASAPQLSNPLFVKQLTGIPCLGYLPRVDSEEPHTARRLLRAHIDLTAIHGLLVASTEHTRI